MILNYVKRLMNWETEREDYENIMFHIQKTNSKKKDMPKESKVNCTGIHQNLADLSFVVLI